MQLTFLFLLFEFSFAGATSNKLRADFAEQKCAFLFSVGTDELATLRN